MINIAMKASCVSREAFNYQEDVFHEDIFHVSKYIFGKPIAVVASDEITDIGEDIVQQLQLELFNQESEKDFVIRQVENSFSKNFYSNNGNENYFLIDFIDERKSLIKLQNSFIEYKKEFVDVLQRNNIEFELQRNSKEIIFSHLDKFITGLKEFYHEENIILHKAYAIHTTKIDGVVYPLTSIVRDPFSQRSRNIYSLRKANALNRLFMAIYDYIEKKYPAIKIIELPIENYYSPEHHRFGKGFYHYNRQYYYDFLGELHCLLIDGSKGGKADVAKQNKTYIAEMVQKQSVLTNLLTSNGMNELLPMNPEELLFGPINRKINYHITTEGKTIIQSYRLSSGLPGIMIYNDKKKILGKLIFDKNNRLTSIYSIHQNGKPRLISFVSNNEVTKSILKDEVGKDIPEDIMVQEESNEKENVFRVTSGDEMLVKITISKDSVSKKIVFYEDATISRVVELRNDKVNRVTTYNRKGEMDEEFIMAEFIQIGKVQFKTTYLLNKSKIKYMYFASGNPKTKTFLTEDDNYISREFYDENSKLTKLISYNPAKNLKTKVIEFKPDGSKTETDYFTTGTRKQTTHYNQNNQQTKKITRETEKELMRNTGTGPLFQQAL